MSPALHALNDAFISTTMRYRPRYHTYATEQRTDCCLHHLAYNFLKRLFPHLYGRTKTSGHPGAPPPNRPKRRKHGKHRNQHAQDESTPPTSTPCETSQGVLARVRRKRRERNPAESRGRITSHGGQARSGSDDSRHASIRPSCPVHPSSASCVRARLMSSDLSRAEVVGARGELDPADCANSRAEGFVEYNEQTRRKRVEGCIISKNTILAQFQASRGEEPAVLKSAASGNKRASLLRVRSKQSLF